MTDIPFFKPTIGNAEVAQATESLLSGWLTSGPKTREFEERFAAAVGAEHAVALNSATAALHLSLLANDIGPGDEVIVPTLTFAAGAEVVLAVGATPIFVDSIAETLAIDTDAALELVTSRTRAIMPMHYGGLPVDVSPFMKLAADQPRIRIIEDAAHAFPAQDENGPVGAQTHGACFSFYANKTITTGEGGMFTTDDAALADRVRRLSLHGLSRDAWKRFETRSAWDYDIVEPGWKYNLTDLAAGIGLAQLDRAEAMAADRRYTAEFYDNAFTSSHAIRPVGVSQRQGSACHLYVIRLAFDVTDTTRDDVIKALGDNGIGSSVHYRPLHMHSYHRETFGFEADDFPVAAGAFREMLSLPLYPGMTDDERTRVVECVLAEVDR